MNDEYKNQEIVNEVTINIINDLSADINSLLINNETIAENDFIYKKNNDLFKKICNSAKESLEYSSEKFNKEKLCYMVATYVLKSGLYFVLEKAYKNGFDFEDL
jgi:hypothetical protein